MFSFTIGYFILVLIVITSDFSALTLSEKDCDLLYVADNYVEEQNENLFGTNTISQEIDESDLIDFDAAKQAEEALNQIYNGGK